MTGCDLFRPHGNLLWGVWRRNFGTEAPDDITFSFDVVARAIPIGGNICLEHFLRRQPLYHNRSVPQSPKSLSLTETES
jgi:hypothetical protein